MTKRDYSNYQKSVISNYYANLDTIALNNLQQLVSELYLAETEKKKNQLWQRIEKAMDKLKLSSSVKSHILKTKDVTVLAKNIQEWLKSAQ